MPEPEPAPSAAPAPAAPSAPATPPPPKPAATPPPATPAAPAAKEKPAAATPAEAPFDYFAALDDLAAEKEKPAAPPAAQKPAEKPAAPAETPPPAEKPAEAKEEPMPQKAPELRAAYQRLKTEVQTLKAELEKARTATPAEDPEKKTLVEALETERKRRETYEQELKYLAYEQTDEYKAKYEEPFLQSYQAGRDKVGRLKIVERKNEDGTVIQAGRAATPQDFDAIMQIADDDSAAEAADRLFGRGAPAVLYHRERVQELNAARIKAVQEFRKNGAEREKTFQAEQIQRRAARDKQIAQMGETFQKLNTEAAERYPQWFKADESDPEAAAILDRGMKLADSAFSGPGKMTAEEMVRLHSVVRSKAGAFDHVVYKLKKAETRLKELETELSQFKASATGDDTGAKPQEGPKMLSADEELDLLAAGKRR